MELVTVGKTILELRKAKNVTQETLASVVGVSAQAVSKWEGGGTPDVELLPRIADFFDVSLDRLFGRDGAYENMDRSVTKAIAETPRSQWLEKAFEYCWAIQSGLMGNTERTPNIQEIAEKGGRPFSRVLLDEGFTTMALSSRLRYFLLMPEPITGWKDALGDINQFTELFQLLGDRVLFAAMCFLYERDNKPFTPKLLERVLHIDEAAAMSCIEKLLSYEILKSATIELDDELKTVYQLVPNPAFIGLLAMCRELIDPPGHFHGFRGGRTKPYLSATSARQEERSSVICSAI